MSDLYIILSYICYDKIVIMFCLNRIFFKIGYPRVGDWRVSAATMISVQARHSHSCGFADETASLTC
jgi:hypothetical protein